MARSAANQIRQNYQHLDKNARGWLIRYQQLRLEAEKQEDDQGLSTRASTSARNIPRNRYRDVLTYDQSRVHLMGRCDDYINASLVPVPTAGRKYILAQAPLANTCEHFWQMIWEQNSHAIIMLNRLIEKNTPKCHKYFPTENDEEKSIKFGQFRIKLINEEQEEHFVVRKLQVKKLLCEEETELNGESEDQPDSSPLCEEPPRSVTHFQFTTWPDFGVPRSTSDFLEFLLEVRKSGFLDCTQYGPPVVHCSAGIGRSGTFVIVDAILVMSQQDDMDIDDMDICNLVLQLRQHRMGLIQTHDQLRFSWQAILDALELEQWKELISTACFTSSPKRRRSFQREVGNQMTSGDSFVSVDNSELVGSPRKRSKVSEPGPSPHSANDLKFMASSWEERQKEMIEPIIEKEESQEIGATSSGSKTKLLERKRRLEEIRKKMKESENHSSLSDFTWYMLCAAVALAGGMATYYFLN